MEEYKFSQETQVLLESIMSSLNKNHELITMAKFNELKHPDAMVSTLSSEPYLTNNATMTVALDKLVNKAQSTSIKDSFTSWFGWFDNNIPQLNAKRSDLLAKKNVQNYTYKRHIWNYQSSQWFFDACIYVINGVLNVTSYTLDPNVQAKVDAKLIDNEVNAYYEDTVNPFIDRYLFGRKKGVAKERIIGIMIGDGFKEVTKKMNFKDDVSISDMLDMAEYLNEVNAKDDFHISEGAIKDIRAQVDKIIKRFMDQSKHSQDKALTTKYIKVCITYVAMMIDKMNECNTADYYSFSIIGTEIINILQGLLDYNGD